LPVYIVCTAIGLLTLRMTSSHWSLYRPILKDPGWIIRALALVSSADQRLVISPAWSLDIEMQFYVVAPLLLFAIARLKVRDAIFFAAGLSAVCIGVWWRKDAFLAHYSQSANAQAQVWWNLVLPRFLAFFLAGILIDRAQWRPSGRVAAGSAGAWLTLVILGTLCGVQPVLVSYDQPPYLFQFYSALLVVAILPLAAFLFCRPSNSMDRHLGNLAYCVYLFHACVWIAWQYCAGFADARHLLIARFLWILILPGSLAIYLAVDQPGEKLRRRFLNSQLRRHPVTPVSPVATGVQA
jgi:peptidoglycan/LPS O-acetylase OafA/YrhL